MNKSHQPNEDEQIEAPQELIDALADLHNERIFVPPSVDESILAEARKRLDPTPVPRKRSNIIAWSGWGGALAASVVLVVSLTIQNRKPFDRSLTESAPVSEMADARPVFKREDINKDQSVDILDAFALARQLDVGGSVPANMDFNNDGVIDRGDVDWIAQTSVKIEKGI